MLDLRGGGKEAGAIDPYLVPFLAKAELDGEKVALRKKGSVSAMSFFGPLAARLYKIPSKISNAKERMPAS